jgi:hypothetical protein
MLFNLALCPQVQVDDAVMQLCFQPSGWFLTTLLNTLKNYRQVTEAYLDCYYAKYGTYCTIDEMREHLKVLCGGDDLAFSTDQEWFNISILADWGRRRGIYLESDFLTPRNPMNLTFFSHSLFSRSMSFLSHPILVAGGRMDKMLSAFSYFKQKKGVIDYTATAMRVTALLTNLWAYEYTYKHVYTYCYHLVHHCFLQSGQILTPEWSGVFKSFPNDFSMYRLWMGSKLESRFSPQ